MGNVIMKARQIQHGATNVEEALNLLSPQELIEMSKRMDAIEAWKNKVRDCVNTGSNMYVIDNALKVPVEALSLNMLPIQSGSGDPSPTNIRPISGRTSVNVGRTGKNLCGEIENGAINPADGQNVPNATTYRTKDYIPVEDGVAYNINNLLAYSQGVRVFFYDTNKNYISNNLFGGTSATAGIPVAVSVANARYMRFHANEALMTNTTPVQVEQGNAPTAYEAPQIITLTIALGTTVYGGSLDVKTGVGSIEWVKVLWNDLTTSVNLVSGTYSCAMRKVLPSGQGATVVSQTVPALRGALCEMSAELLSSFGSNPSANCNNEATQNGGFAIGWDGTDVTIYDSDTTLTQEQFSTKYADCGICYPLATPTTVQLTGAELEMLKGYNLITTDADSMDVTALVLGGEV